MSQQDWLSNGLGGQSMYMLLLAAQRQIPATVSITACTGSENDRVCSTGERMSSPEFFIKYVSPYAHEHKIEAIMVRSRNKDGELLPPLIDVLRSSSGDTFKEITREGISVPLFTNDQSAGRLLQSCTDKWKIRAIHQEARRRGIKLLRSAIGFHRNEAHRIKANWKKTDNGSDIYKPYVRRKGRLVEVKWLEHYYPLIDMGLSREQIRVKLDRIGLPYLVTTECDHCPHQDYPRWAAHRPEVIQELVQIESKWEGKLFFTDKRIPLNEALDQMRIEHEERQKRGSLFGADFGCEDGAYCGI